MNAFLAYDGSSGTAPAAGRAIYTVAFGGEIQANIHYAMPVKNGLYDFIYYARQVKQADRSYRNQDGKEDRIDLS